jgi:hypothetical protein
VHVASLSCRLQGPGYVPARTTLAAVKEKGVLSGKRIERSETGEPGEFEGMNETELADYISQKMVELGIEIVREEESELTALSST